MGRDDQMHQIPIFFISMESLLIGVLNKDMTQNKTALTLNTNTYKYFYPSISTTILLYLLLT